MILGIVFLFVVAAEPRLGRPRRAHRAGAAASRRCSWRGSCPTRFGRLNAALAAVGVGVAGAYATLAAATIVYGFLPFWAALLVAAGIAAAGGAIALAWSSEIVAGLALGGAAVAPALIGLDEGVSAPGPAFALVVLAATVAAAAPRRWLRLAAVGAVALGQVVWLVAASTPEDPGALAVVGIASLVPLPAAPPGSTRPRRKDSTRWPGRPCSWAPGSRSVRLASSCSSTEMSGSPLPSPQWCTESPQSSCPTLARLRHGRAAAALMLAGLATAHLLSGRSLSIALAISATALAGLAWRLRTPRFALASLVYLALGIAHVVVVELQSLLESGDIRSGTAPALFVLAGAALTISFLLPADRGDASSPGLLAALEPIWDELVRVRDLIRAVLAGLTVGLAAAGTAGLLSGRWLTIVVRGRGILGSRRSPWKSGTSLPPRFRCSAWPLCTPGRSRRRPPRSCSTVPAMRSRLCRASLRWLWPPSCSRSRAASTPERPR